MQTKFLYHAEAVGLSGYITLPVQEMIDIQAAAALPINGGQASSRVENFNHRNFVSIKSAESHVIGSFSAKDNAHGTMASTVIEGLNILNVVTCDRIVVRLTSKHNVEAKTPEDGEASYILHGTRFENLRIAGFPIEPDLAVDTFSELSTWTKLNNAHSSDGKKRESLKKLAMYPKDGNELPVSRGVYGCRLARGLDSLPGGLTVKDGGIYVPHFGTVYIGEFFIAPQMRRLMALHVDLGCSTEGCVGAGHGGGNGMLFP
jgi:hypothetical protein